MAMTVSTARTSRGSTESIQRKSYFKVQKNRSPPCLGSRSQQPWTRSRTADTEPSAPVFACPIAKRHPGIVSRSCLSGWSSMARVKEHLQRKHKRPPYCVRCVTEFKTEKELKDHLRNEETCKLRLMPPEPDNLWLKDGMDELLSRRSKKGEDPVETWRYLYSKLFKIADANDIPSPYFQHPNDPQYVRKRIVLEFVQLLTDAIRSTVDPAGTLCPTFKLKYDDVLDIINSTMNAYIKGQGVRATKTTTSAEVSSDRSGDWDNTDSASVSPWDNMDLASISPSDLSPVELEQYTSTDLSMAQAQVNTLFPSTWNEPPWSSFNSRTNFRHRYLPPLEDHHQNLPTSYHETGLPYDFNECLNTNSYDPYDISYNTTDSLSTAVSNSSSSASPEDQWSNQAMALTSYRCNDVRKNNLVGTLPWHNPYPPAISLLE